MTINLQRVYFLRILQFLGNEKTRKIANGPLGIFSVLFSFHSGLTFHFILPYLHWISWLVIPFSSSLVSDSFFPLLSFFFFTLRFCLLSRSSFIYKRLLDSHTTPFPLWKQIRLTNKVASEFCSEWLSQCSWFLFIKAKWLTWKNINAKRIIIKKKRKIVSQALFFVIVHQTMTWT